MKNQKGFTLIELLIGLAISSVIMLANIQMFLIMNRNMRALNLSQELVEFVQRVSLITFKPASCTIALFNQAFDPAVKTEITYAEPGGVSIQAGSEVGGLKFKSVALKSRGAIGANEYLTDLVFVVDKIGDISGPRTLVRAVPLRLRISGNVVQECVP